MAHTGFEPVISALRGRCPSPLDECANDNRDFITLSLVHKTNCSIIYEAKTLPSGVVVALVTLDHATLVRIQARQPITSPTRAKLLGHKILVLDDPVQSMDEEHFKTFARDLISKVLNQGFQVILLTHNDTFARDVSHFHYDRPDYVTMSIRHSRSAGSVVEEGNRRVAERLKLSEHRLDQGHFDEAWKYIRFAIERLYTISYAKYGTVTSFRPESWQHQSAEYMWNSGSGEVILSRLPDSENRLKDILDMTAGAAHDTQSKGETDIRDSLTFLRKVLNDLKVGG